MKGRKSNVAANGPGVTPSDAPPREVYAGGGSNVVKAALKRKRGGAVKDCGPDGKMSKMRLDRPGRKTGGRIGADTAPLSSAARLSKPGGLTLDD